MKGKKTKVLILVYEFLAKNSFDCQIYTVISPGQTGLPVHNLSIYFWTKEQAC